MLLIELAIAAVIWISANVFACKWLADAYSALSGSLMLEP